MTFHNKCDNIENQLVLKTKEGLKFGGYTRLGFNSSEKAIIDKDAFLFSFDTMKIYDAILEQGKIYCYKSCGPTFGNNNYDILIPNKYFSSQGELTLKMKTLNYKDYELNGGNQYFKFKEVEVFQIIFE